MGDTDWMWCYENPKDAAAEIDRLRNALRAFSLLSWAPDAAPGPSCYEVYPVHDAREALRNAGVLLTGKSPFPSDNDGSVMISNGKIFVWLDGMAYGEDQRERVPEKHLATFDAAVMEAQAAGTARQEKARGV